MTNSRYEACGNLYQSCRTINTPFDTAPELKMPLNKLYEKIVNLHASKELCIEDANNYLTSILLYGGKYSVCKMKLFVGNTVILIDEPNKQSAVRMYA